MSNVTFGGRGTLQRCGMRNIRHVLNQLSTVGGNKMKTILIVTTALAFAASGPAFADPKGTATTTTSEQGHSGNPPNNDNGTTTTTTTTGPSGQVDNGKTDCNNCSTTTTTTGPGNK
ncbi:hypothetical protein AMC79_CH01833 [Rhizobium phaseoli]|nr:hypothetical protein AMC79_CH01833 [Rhizobium phaseoli]